VNFSSTPMARGEDRYRGDRDPVIRAWGVRFSSQILYLAVTSLEVFTTHYTQLHLNPTICCCCRSFSIPCLLTIENLAAPYFTDNRCKSAPAARLSLSPHPPCRSSISPHSPPISNSKSTSSSEMGFSLHLDSPIFPSGLHSKNLYGNKIYQSRRCREMGNPSPTLRPFPMTNPFPTTNLIPKRPPPPARSWKSLKTSLISIIWKVDGSWYAPNTRRPSERFCRQTQLILRHLLLPDNPESVRRSSLNHLRNLIFNQENLSF